MPYITWISWMVLELDMLFLLSTKVNSCDLRFFPKWVARSNLQIILKESGNGEAWRGLP